jgi:RNA polymerase sigma-70 factor (ECF subfamily)
MPMWRKDGRELYFVTDDGTIMATRLTGDASSLQASSAVRLFQAQLPVWESSPEDRVDYAPSEDGQRFLIDLPLDDQTAIHQALPLVYKELRRLAGGYLRHQVPGHTLTPTALVHEAYLRLVDRTASDWKDRGHFVNIAATIMRQILVDHARAKVAAKRGGGAPRVQFTESLSYTDEKAAQVVALDDALHALAEFDDRKARTIELRYFGGLSTEETAEVMGVSVATVGRETRYAEAWLRRKLLRGRQ